MKVLVIGDVHGSHKWHRVYEKINKVDRAIFLGDFFDNWVNDWVNFNQIENFENVLEFRRMHPDKVIVLLGNHDLNSYLMPHGEAISGHQINKEIDIKECLEKHLSEVDIAWKLNDWVFSHAGFSKTWMRNNDIDSIKMVNQCFHDKIWTPFRFSGYDMFGKDNTQGPLWIRPGALISDMYFKKQVVGHTELANGPEKYEYQGNILYVVDQPDHGAFLEIEI